MSRSVLMADGRQVPRGITACVYGKAALASLLRHFVGTLVLSTGLRGRRTLGSWLAQVKILRSRCVCYSKGYRLER